MKSYGEVVAATREKNTLFSVLIELTYHCNLDCFFCYNDTNLRGKPLQLEQYFGLLTDLSEMQVMHLILTGGEPLAHPHVLEIGEKARQLGFAIRIKTNGHALHGALLDQVTKRIDPLCIEVSLHGASAATHDRQTRVAGSFERLVANLKSLAAQGVKTKINATLTAWNEHQIDSMFALADSFSIPIQFDFEVTPRDDGDTQPQEIRASQSGIEQLLRRQRQRAARNAAEPPVMREGDQASDGPSLTRHCGAGCSTVAIDPFGAVYPCVQWRRPIGNLHEQSIEEIWHRSANLETIRSINSQVRGKMGQLGDNARLTAFCPGLAEQQTGSPLNLYPGAEERLEIHLKIQSSSEE
ncbi:MAG: radical SAM protein [bacterium]|nr:radical SAM protein [bacterium]